MNWRAEALVEENMEIATINIPAFTDSVDDITIQLEDNKRFTMRDIGRLEKRIERVEEYTTLNLLEQQAEALQVQDANGLDRFKTGFVVDNFQGQVLVEVDGLPSCFPHYRAFGLLEMRHL